MTGPGTNTYLVGIDEVAVIDPGPSTKKHLDAIVACGSGRIRWIVLTHTHPDHAPGAVKLKKMTGAEVLAHSAIDGEIKLDGTLADRDVIEATEFRMQAVHTPGHASNHLCFHLPNERLLFTGDHIMQGSTVVINPPDGDMAAYFSSLEKIRKLRLKRLAPGHGHVVDDPKALIDYYLAHRRQREAQILKVLKAAPKSMRIPALVESVYDETIVEALHPVAARSVFAHLLKLRTEGKVKGKDEDSLWRPS
jgi:glyoxylase-like metal-dependent hydrolase (beta-lactamase superfamily II)